MSGATTLALPRRLRDPRSIEKDYDVKSPKAEP